MAYLVAYEGLRRGFRQFPWEPRKLPTMNLQTDLTAPWQSEPCGWPYDRMLREIGPARRFPRADAVLCCMLGTWWLFVLTSLISDRNNRYGVLAAALVFATFASWLARLLIYLRGYQSPLTFWGRIGTFRLLIPGYDQVLVAPFCTLIVAPVTLAVLVRARVPLDISVAIATGLTVLCALLAPPRLRRWRLTGRHRIVHTAPQSQASSATLVKVG
jgi:hypothetical protein